MVMGKGLIQIKHSKTYQIEANHISDLMFLEKQILWQDVANMINKSSH